MREYMELSVVPYDEPCVQVGSEDYGRWSRIECKAYIAQLRREFGVEPEGASMYTKSNPHDFGTYYEVAVRYDDDIEAALDYAYLVEGGVSEGKWDEAAKQELSQAGYPFPKS